MAQPTHGQPTVDTMDLTATKTPTSHKLLVDTMTDPPSPSHVSTSMRIDSPTKPSRPDTPAVFPRRNTLHDIVTPLSSPPISTASLLLQKKLNKKKSTSQGVLHESGAVVGARGRRASASASYSAPGSMARIASLLESDTDNHVSRVVESEMAHERATTLLFRYLSDPPSPVLSHPSEPPLLLTSAVSLPKDNETLGEFPLAELAEQADAFHIPLPRVAPIPKDQIHNPANYISKSSKLNPENTFPHRQERLYASPTLSPIHAPLSPMLYGERKGKRKLSMDEQATTHHTPKRSRGVHSPTMMISTTRPGSGCSMMDRATPSPTLHPPPAYFYFSPALASRKRSTSISSMSSVTSSHPMETCSSGYRSDPASQPILPSSCLDSDMHTDKPHAVKSIPFLPLQHHYPPRTLHPAPLSSHPAPALGQMLNLSGTQGEFGRMSLSEE